jgi:hypothetical protein
VIRRVEVDIVGGNIRINAADRQDVAIHTDGDVRTLGARTKVDGDVFRVESSSALRYFLQRGRIDLVLDVPAAAAIDIRVFGADIVVNGGTGPLSVRGFAGAIEGETHSADVRVKFRVGSDDLVRLGPL